MMIHLVISSPNGLQYASKELKDDEDLTIESNKQYAPATRDASEGLQNEDITKKAV